MTGSWVSVTNYEKLVKHKISNETHGQTRYPKAMGGTVGEISRCLEKENRISKWEIF